MARVATVLAFSLMLVAPEAAFAYVGPGAGLSLLGALWALVAALGMALFFVVAWPVRNMLKRRRERREAEAANAAAKPADSQANPSP